MSIAEADLLNPNEVAPVAPKEPGLDICPAEGCDRTFSTTVGGRLGRANHIRATHPEIWELHRRNKPKPTAKKKPGPKPKAPGAAGASGAPKPRASRRSLAGFLEKMLVRVGSFTGSLAPAGSRALVFSAPAAGPAIDGLLAGSRLDKPMQKIASTSDKWEKVGDALGLPVMIFLVEARPELFPLLEGDIRDAVTGVLVDALPRLREKRAKQQKVVNALSELGEIAPELAGSNDPIGDIVRGFFVTPEQEVAEPSPEMDGAGI